MEKKELLSLFQREGGLLRSPEKWGIREEEIVYLIENKEIEKIEQESYRLIPYQDLSLLPSPYSTIQSPLPLQLHSFFRRQNGIHLENIIKKEGVKKIVELGSWLGKSTLHMASLLPENGTLYAIDHWLGSTEHRENPEWSHYLLFAYEQFLSNVIHAKLAKQIIPIKMDTKKAVTRCIEEVDLVYVDASHEEQDVYEDLQAWYPFIERRGIFCGDDWSWGEREGYPVQQAVKRFCAEKLLPYTTDGWFWRTSRTLMSYCLCPGM